MEISAAVPDVWWADAPDRVHYRGTQFRKILEHIGVDSQPPRISPARGPPLWNDGDAQMDDGAQIEPDWGLAAQLAPDHEVDQMLWPVALRLAGAADRQSLSWTGFFGDGHAKQGLAVVEVRVLQRFEACSAVRYFASCGCNAYPCEDKNAKGGDDRIITDLI